jgi:hypothetical protein
MTAGQSIAVILNSVTAITAIVSTRIYNGNRPTGTVVPCINYYELSGGKNKYSEQSVSYSINCRATTAETALTLARLVDETFNGTSGSGMYGTASSGSVFSINRSWTIQRQGLLPEPDDGIYNAPVDIHVIYPSGTVS